MKNITKILTFGLLAAGLYSCNPNHVDTTTYELKPAVALKFASSTDDLIDLKTFVDMAKFPENYPNAQIVDLRTPDEFDANHIDGAINIPLKSIVEGKDCNVRLDHNKLNVLVGATADDAADAGMLLKMVGMSNYMVCALDYSFIKANILDNLSVYSGKLDPEAALYDYSKVISETPGNATSGGSATAAPAPAAPVAKREKKAAGGGGCG